MKKEIKSANQTIYHHHHHHYYHNINNTTKMTVKTILISVLLVFDVVVQQPTTMHPELFFTAIHDVAYSMPRYHPRKSW
jgi:hypothetical protein